MFIHSKQSKATLKRYLLTHNFNLVGKLVQCPLSHFRVIGGIIFLPIIHIEKNNTEMKVNSKSLCQLQSNVLLRIFVSQYTRFMCLIISLNAIKTPQVKPQCIPWLTKWKSVVSVQRAFKWTCHMDPPTDKTKIATRIMKNRIVLWPQIKVADKAFLKQMLNE